MNKQEVDDQLNKWINELPKEDNKVLLAHLSGLKSVFPFNEYEYRLMFLLDHKIISFKEYESLRNAYTQTNQYLHLYSISPRTFGEIWAEQHLRHVVQEFKKPNKEIDKKYNDEYDLYCETQKNIIKIEVKASRAINSKKRGGLETKALSYGSDEPLWMNFQQLKLNIADVFIFVGVWVDKILYWVLSNKEIKNHPLRSHQHRGGVEFQIGVTDKNIKEFDKFLVRSSDLLDVVKKKAK